MTRHDEMQEEDVLWQISCLVLTITLFTTKHDIMLLRDKIMSFGLSKDSERIISQIDILFHLK